MALSAQDFQKAFTVDAPIGDYITKGIADVKAAREAREKKELEQQKFVYQEIDPLTVGTGTPDDPYIVSLVADAQQKIAQLPRNLSPGQHYARVMQILGPIKGRRQEAVMLKTQIEKEAAAEHDNNPLTKPKVIAADAIKNAYFNPDGTPKSDLDFNQNHVASTLASGDLKYYDMDLAQANAMKWSTEQAKGFAGRPSTRPYTTYTGTISPFFEIKESSQGATPEQIYQKTMKYKRDDGTTVDVPYRDDLPKMLPDDLYQLSQSNPGYKLLTQRNYKQFKELPQFNGYDDNEIRRAAAYEAIRQATDLSVMKIQDEVNRPPARSGDDRGGGSTATTPKPDINWFNMPQYISQGGAPDLTSHMGPQTTTNAGAKATQVAINDIFSGRNPNAIGGKGLSAAIQNAYKKIGADQATEVTIDVSGQAPNKKMVIGLSDDNDQFGNPKPIFGTAKFVMNRNGSKVLKIYNESGKEIKSYDYTQDPVAAQDQFMYDFGPYNKTNTYESNQDVRTRPNSAATRIATQTLNK